MYTRTFENVAHSFANIIPYLSSLRGLIDTYFRASLRVPVRVRVHIIILTHTRVYRTRTYSHLCIIYVYLYVYVRVHVRGLRITLYPDSCSLFPYTVLYRNVDRLPQPQFYVRTSILCIFAMAIEYEFRPDRRRKVDHFTRNEESNRSRFVRFGI